MFDRLHTMFARWRTLKEVEALEERDLEDMGLSREQVEDFACMPEDVPDRIEAMARLFGLGAAQLRADYPTYLELVHDCGHCAERRLCARILVRADATPAAAAFCPNAHTYAAMSAA